MLITCYSEVYERCSLGFGRGSSVQSRGWRVTPSRVDKNNNKIINKEMYTARVRQMRDVTSHVRRFVLDQMEQL